MSYRVMYRTLQSDRIETWRRNISRLTATIERDRLLEAPHIVVAWVTDGKRIIGNVRYGKAAEC